MNGSSLFATSAALLLLLARAPGAPEPGPEQRRLNFFAGTWSFRLDMKPNPFGPGGIVTGTDRNEMLPGGFFLVRRFETKSPVGDIRGLEVIGYDSEARAYLQRGFDSFGQAHTYRGTVQGDTWTWTYEAKAGGQLYKVRITLKEASPILQIYRSDISPDGETWTTVLEGTLRKER